MQKKDIMESISYWIEEGELHIPKNLWKKWEKFVETCANSQSEGKELDSFLNILDGIDSNEIENSQDIEDAIDFEADTQECKNKIKDMLNTFLPKYSEIMNERENG